MPQKKPPSTRTPSRTPEDDARTPAKTKSPTPLDPPAFRRALVDWFERSQRKLPWRTERSLYRTVVSELMLQQTQVATVLPYFHRWMQALPDFAALASAEESTVLKLWEGLGYYRRARFLHRLARELAALPAPPREASGWAGLTGVGPYTAAAIASLAFDDPAACVDGNVVRILARITGETRSFSDGSAAVKQFTPLAVDLLDHAHPGRHNEAMMELGATVCLRRRPLCTICPVLAFCASRRAGIEETIPRIDRPSTERREVDRAWHVRESSRGHEELLLHRIPEDAARMNGLHELPDIGQLGLSRDALGKTSLLATHRRAITRYQITERIHDVTASKMKFTPDRGLVWVPLDQLDTITLSGPHRRWISALLQRTRQAPGQS